MGSPPRRLAAFSRAPPGSEEGVGAGVPGGQEQPSLEVTGRSSHWGDSWQGRAGAALRLERGLRLGVGEGPGGLEGLKPWWQALGKADRLGPFPPLPRRHLLCRSLRRPQAPLRPRQSVLAARRGRGGRGGPP